MQEATLDLRRTKQKPPLGGLLLVCLTFWFKTNKKKKKKKKSFFKLWFIFFFREKEKKRKKRKLHLVGLVESAGEKKKEKKEKRKKKEEGKKKKEKLFLASSSAFVIRPSAALTHFPSVDIAELWENFPRLSASEKWTQAEMMVFREGVALKMVIRRWKNGWKASLPSHHSAFLLFLLLGACSGWNSCVDRLMCCCCCFLFFVLFSVEKKERRKRKKEKKKKKKKEKKKKLPTQFFLFSPNHAQATTGNPSLPAWFFHSQSCLGNLFSPPIVAMQTSPSMPTSLPIGQSHFGGGMGCCSHFSTWCCWPGINRIDCLFFFPFSASSLFIFFSSPWQSQHMEMHIFWIYFSFSIETSFYTCWRMKTFSKPKSFRIGFSIHPLLSKISMPSFPEFYGVNRLNSTILGPPPASISHCNHIQSRNHQDHP